MICFSTEFPINNESSVEDVLTIARKWIADSRHSKIKHHDFEPTIRKTEASISIDNEHVTTGYAAFDDYEISGLRYTKLEKGGVEWTSTIVASQTPHEHLVSIQISCETIRTSSSLPAPKKPVFIKQILRHIGGGKDGLLDISNKPTLLKTGEEDIAASYINGHGNNTLPIVYISANFNNEYDVNIDDFADKLSGLAHVVVEPDRNFSIKLKDLCASRNVYGGTIGVYWPDSIARKSFFLSQAQNNPILLSSLIENDIRVALSNRRQRTYCTWLHLKECISKHNYNELKRTGSTEINDYISAFDKDIAAKQEKIDSAEKEILRLQAELSRINAEKFSREEGILSYGEEQDLYPYEIRNFVVDTLERQLQNSIRESRRYHILHDLIKTNKTEGIASNLKEEIKSIFKSYVEMDAKTKSSLTRIGFDISEEGKHYKIVFHQDGRYTFSVSKSSSDSRAGKNLASDINKKIF
ncbi:hypothetical protein [Aeromonas enteropelogenes]|uniref:hypothetical protein n=1 Tax=Aeromonas enteropelogenes TaxID=29489 RepID=UPI00403DF775